MRQNLTQADAAALLGVVRETVTRSERKEIISRGLERRLSEHKARQATFINNNGAVTEV